MSLPRGWLGATPAFAVAAQAQGSWTTSRERQLNEFTAGWQGDPQVAARPDGSVVVVWESDGGFGSDPDYSIQARRFASDGSPLDPVEFQVNSHTDSNQTNPAVAARADGGFVVSWLSPTTPGGSHWGVLARRFAADGTSLDPADLQVSTTTSSATLDVAVAVAPDGSFWIVWTYLGTGSIYGRQYTSDGVPVQPAEVVLDDGTGSHSYPRIATWPDGSFAVVWQVSSSPGDPDYAIEAKRFASDGTPLDAEEWRANVYTDSFQTNPVLAIQPDEGLVLGWASNGSHGTDDGWSTQVRRFDAEGNPIDASEFQVNTATVGQQRYPSLTAMSEGGFALAWDSWDSWGDDDDWESIQVRRFTADARPRDVRELQANTYVASHQDRPSVAALPDGQLFVVWRSDGSWGSDRSDASIQGRILSPGIFADGFESGDTSAWSTAMP